MLEADLEAGYFAWLAWVIDMGSFAAISILYFLTAVLIFVVAKATEPSMCARSGLDEGCLMNTSEHNRGM